MSTNSDTAAPVATRRKHPRTASQKTGTIHTKPGAPPVRCAVLDTSLGGAGLSLWVGSTFGLPDTFELEIDGEPRRLCRVAWTQPHKLGVEFKD